MVTGKNVFIVGPGFIGWNVLELLVGEGYNVSGLVRRELHGEQIRNSGATAIKGDLNDHDLIVEHVLKNDVSGKNIIIQTLQVWIKDQLARSSSTPQQQITSPPSKPS
jgi:nucleoside-diphosphate-sugar epimerase